MQVTVINDPTYLKTSHKWNASKRQCQALNRARCVHAWVYRWEPRLYILLVLCCEWSETYLPVFPRFLLIIMALACVPATFGDVAWFGAEVLSLKTSFVTNYSISVSSLVWFT